MKYYWSVFVIILMIACKREPKEFKIAFGSCANQDLPQPVLDVAVNHKPDLFIFLGDNIYGDTQVPDTLEAKYQRWQKTKYYRNVLEHMPIIATWDDHDYGWNDSGKEYPYKNISKEMFLTAFDEPLDSKRREHPGIYTSYIYDFGGQKIQVILLDVRTFRDGLTHAKKEHQNSFYKLDYIPTQTPDSTLLGKEQWAWLENELKKPADIRLIGSGTQFAIEYNGYESWANFPYEQKKMLNLIKDTKANGVVFLTGDVHYAEISKISPAGQYPIYDITSSGITSTWDFATPNKQRIEGPVMENHVGLLTISKEKGETILKAEIYDVNDNQRIEYKIPLSSLQLDGK